MQLKKLKLSAEKCANIHIGNKDSRSRCHVKKVHGEDMNNSEKEKYWGDFVTKMESSRKPFTIKKIRGNAITIYFNC